MIYDNGKVGMLNYLESFTNQNSLFKWVKNSQMRSFQKGVEQMSFLINDSSVQNLVRIRESVLPTIDFGTSINRMFFNDKKYWFNEGFNLSNHTQLNSILSDTLKFQQFPDINNFTRDLNRFVEFGSKLTNTVSFAKELSNTLASQLHISNCFLDLDLKQFTTIHSAVNEYSQILENTTLKDNIDETDIDKLKETVNHSVIYNDQKLIPIGNYFYIFVLGILLVKEFGVATALSILSFTFGSLKDILIPENTLNLKKDCIKGHTSKVRMLALNKGEALRETKLYLKPDEVAPQIAIISKGVSGHVQRFQDDWIRIVYIDENKLCHSGWALKKHFNIS